MRIPLTICGFHLRFADSIYNLLISLTVAVSATAQFNKCFSICSWIPQTVLDSTNTVADSANSPIFVAILSATIFRYLFVESKTA